MRELLYRAIVSNDLTQLKQLLEEHKNSSFACAILDERIEETFDTTLHLACRFAGPDVVSEIVRLRPHLVAALNAEGETAVHDACRYGNLEALEMLLGANPFVAHWLNLLNNKRQSAFYIACENGHNQLVRVLIKLQQETSLQLFDNSADLCLHVAAKRGHSGVVEELIKAWPSLTETTDVNGLNPLHCACQHGHPNIARMLLTPSPDLARQYDNGGFTPLHLAIVHGKAMVIEEFLGLAPDAFQILTQGGETVLHLAVRHNQVATFFGLVHFIGHADELFDKSDSQGNNLLHIALSGNYVEDVKIAEYLIDYSRAEQLAIQNHGGFTALDILESLNRDDPVTLHLKDYLLTRLAEYESAEIPAPEMELNQDNQGVSNTVTEVQGVDPIDIKMIEENLKQKYAIKKIKREEKLEREERRRKKMYEMHIEALHNARNTINVIAVLIGTVTFTAGLNPPGGFLQDGPHQGKTTLGRTKAFKVFSISNDLALLVSLCIVIVLVSVVPFRKKPLKKLLAIAHKVLWLAISFMATAYIAARWATAAHTRQDDSMFVGVFSVCGSVLGLIFMALTVMLIKNALKKTQWRKQRSIRDGRSISTDSDMESNVDSGHYLY